MCSSTSRTCAFQRGQFIGGFRMTGYSLHLSRRRTGFIGCYVSCSTRRNLWTTTIRLRRSRPIFPRTDSARWLRCSYHYMSLFFLCLPCRLGRSRADRQVLLPRPISTRLRHGPACSPLVTSEPDLSKRNLLEGPQTIYRR